MPQDIKTPKLISGEQVRVENKISSMLAMFISFLSEMAESFELHARRAAVIAGTAIYDKVFVPGTIFAIGLGSAIARVATRAKHTLMCEAHELYVKLARIKANRLTAVTIMTSLLIVVMSMMVYSVGLQITIDGEPVGYVMAGEDFEQGLMLVEKQVSEVLGRPYTMNPNVMYSFEIVDRDKVLNGQQLRNLLFSRISEVSELYVLTVDGEVVGASASEATLKNMINEILNPSSDPNVRTEFNREVKIAKQFADTSFIRSYDEMRELLMSNIHEEQTYEIRPGDTLERIARKHGTNKATILSYNPGLDPGRLIAGKDIVVKPAIPFLSVTQTRRVEYTEQIAYKTVEIKDSTIYRGKTKVKTNGVKGQTKVVADVVYKDNKEVSRTILSTQVVREPVDKVVLVGTKTPPKTMATGKLRRPVVGGYISSNYGYRRRGREFHTGVDFAISYGSRVSAADGGTVSFAGWKGDYGYLVIINHGNGLQTYYAHNSKLTVRAGQKVAKGEQIAKIGSTGRSTGPHCHFEVRVNGKHVSPWKYIS